MSPTMTSEQWLRVKKLARFTLAVYALAATYVWFEVIVALWFSSFVS